MTILEIITNKINDLKKNSQEEINRITSILNVINSSIEALDNELIFKDYDFSIAINLVNSNSFGIIDLEKNIKDIKNILVAKYDYKQSFLTISSEGKQAIKSFKERLGYLKEELEKRIIEQSNVEVDETLLENLEDFKSLLEGKGRRKYYTYEMLESLFEIVDYESFSYSDVKELIKELSICRNIKGRIEEEKKDINEVISLYERYLGTRLNQELLLKYQDEICVRIDLDNTRNILDFFKENNLLSKFSILAILEISLYGRFDYVKELYLDKIVKKDSNTQSIYYEDIMACVWINEKSTERRRNNYIKKTNGKSKKKSLFDSIHEVCDDDIWENIRLLKENESILSDKYDLSNIDYLWVITKPTWLIKKNIELFKIFNFSDVKLTALVQNDLEDKIHFVTELGLLNTPRTNAYDEYGRGVPKYQEFMLNGKKKRNNILNYYSNNTSEIGKTSYTEYIYWYYKMLRSGKNYFYQDFFSSIRAGMRNKQDFYDKTDIEIIKDSKGMEKLIDDVFVSNYYDALIPNYDIYDETIKEYSLSNKGDIVIPYFDDSILSNPEVLKLEEYMAINTYQDTNTSVKNPFTYLFGDMIISRYKVLRNLSILNNKYGYLNSDMILTSIVRNSYIDRNTFDIIKNSMMEVGLVK